DYGRDGRLVDHGRWYLNAPNRRLDCRRKRPGLLLRGREGGARFLPAPLDRVIDALLERCSLSLCRFLTTTIDFFEKSIDVGWHGSLTRAVVWVRPGQPPLLFDLLFLFAHGARDDPDDLDGDREHENVKTAVHRIDLFDLAPRFIEPVAMARA